MFNAYLGGVYQKNYKRNIFVENKLCIETYIIGYKNEGEAILFFIKADDIISFSGLVDSFRIENADKVNDILHQNKVPYLDFICWTHPDLDHSKGLKQIIDQYATNQTDIWIPEGVDSQEINCSQEVQMLFQYLEERVKWSCEDKNVYSASDCKDLMYYNSICFSKNRDIFPLDIVSYAPNSKIIRKQNYLDQFIKNDRSICFVLALGNVRIFFTGDVEDDTIEQINFPIGDTQHVHIIKIPHHGSNSSTKMLDTGWKTCDLACSTVYRKGRSNLPISDVMEQYSQRAENLLCTGNKNQQKERNLYGVIKVVTDVLEDTYSFELNGNATIWEKDI